MKYFLVAAAIITATFTTSAMAADVGVSISIGQPGFYGRLDLGDFPPPQVIHPQPIIIERGRVVDRPPVYLRVPQKHRKNWKKYCRKYDACGEQVIFVRDDWYTREYVPLYRERHRQHREERWEDRRDERREERRQDRREEHEDRRGGDRGRGR
jgi:hypothetical protein